MLKSPPCIVVLPVEERVRFGFGEIERPQVTISFFLEKGRVHTFEEATTILPRELKDWLAQIPLEHLAAIEGRHLRLDVDHAAGLVFESNEISTDDKVLQCAEFLLVRMRERHALMTEIVAHLPALEQLRGDLDAFVRARLRLALERHESVDSVGWLVVSACECCCPDGRDWSATAPYMRSVVEPAYRLRDHTSPVFVVPTFTFGRCREVSRLRLIVSHMTIEAGKLLMPEILKAAYEEFAPEILPGPVWTDPIQVMPWEW